jgi:hypothetical protein
LNSIQRFLGLGVAANDLISDFAWRFLKPSPLAPLPKGEGNQILLLLALWERRLGGEVDLLST